MDARRFVGAVLAPHHAEDAEFGKGRLASAQQLLEFFIFFGREAVFPYELRSNGKGWGGGHEEAEALFSHFATPLGRESWGRREADGGRRPQLYCHPMKSVVIGTAGHIDHGKTALVKALTGIDADRLEEEKRRGITIDLGFAHLQLTPSLRLAFVDVPGHERFVKNMLAGVGGIDLVLFVIAADESIKPQTHEHFDICRLLGIPQGVVALTKADPTGRLTS